MERDWVFRRAEYYKVSASYELPPSRGNRGRRDLHAMENFQRFFHTMEKLLPFFPHNGKSFRDFSTQWKNFFHGVENLVLGLFSGVLGLFSGAVERSTRRPLSTVERDRPRGREKRRPPQAISALSRSRLGCGVVARPIFSGPVVGDPRALRCEGGVAGGAVFIGGAVKNS